MLIDWFTVGAQVVNFLILVWLLKHFLYKPILHVIDEREKRIAKELADANKRKVEAQKERDEFQHKNSKFDQQRAALMNKATQEAKTERQRLFDEARQAADIMSTKWQEALKNEAHKINQAISHRTRLEVFAIARKALNDLAETSLEECLAAVFIRRLQDIDEQSKKDLRESLKAATKPALIRSAFDLPVAQRIAIQQKLNQILSTEILVCFETAPDLISGIELITNGQKVAWSISNYLLSLEKGVEELLKEKKKPQARERKPSDLAQQLGKQAYELYKEPRNKEDLADQEREESKHEIPGVILESAKTDFKPGDKAESESKIEAKSDAKDQ